MRLLFTSHFDRSFREKYNEAENKWQARVNRDWRFYFPIVDDAYVMTDIMAHPK